MLERTRLAPGVREKNETVRFALDYFHAGVACPFLVNESCGIYPIRPMKCREYLVTSPAENCAAPTAETIRMVELPTTFSKHLFHFGRNPAAEGPKWLPLVLLFEWAEAHRAEPQRTDEGIQLFREFLAAFVDATPDDLDALFTPGADAVSCPGEEQG
jgi:Fe-S-cluster containining protein